MQSSPSPRPADDLSEMDTAVELSMADLESCAQTNLRIQNLLSRCGLENNGRGAVKFILRMQKLANPDIIT